MNKKISNDQNIKNLKKREILRICIIIFSILTIVFAFLNLFYDVSLIFGIVFFIITVVLNKIREKTIINKKDELKEIREAIKENKKKFAKK